MLSIVKSMALMGLNGYLVDVQTDIAEGLPAFDIVRITRCKCKRIKRKNKSCYKKFKIRISK